MAWKARITATTLNPLGPSTTIEVSFYDATATPTPGPSDFLWVTTYSTNNFASLAELRAKVEQDGQVIRATSIRGRIILDTLSVGQEITIP